MAQVALETVCGAHPPYTCAASCNATTNECGPCASGWGNDRVMFHMQNCSQPDAFIPVLCALVFASSLVGEVMLVPRLRRVRANAARTILWSAQVSLIGMVCAHIILIAMDHSNVGYFFFIAVAGQGISVSLTTTIVTQAKIVFSVARQAFPERLFRIVFVASVVTLGSPLWFLLTPAYSASIPDVVVGNTMLAVGLMLIPVQLIVTGPILLRASTMLLAALNESANSKLRVSQSHSPSRGLNSKSPRSGVFNTGGDTSSAPSETTALSNRERVERLIRRIRIFKLGMVATIISEVAGCVGVGLLYLVGRTPYSWIIMIMLVACLQGSILIFITATTDARSTSTTAPDGGAASPANSKGKGTGKKGSSRENSAPTGSAPTFASQVGGSARNLTAVATSAAS